MNMFDLVSNVASILGFIISVYLIFSIRKIHNHFLFKARFPQLKDKLIEMASRLIDLLQDFEKNKLSIKHNLRLIDTILKNLQKKVHGDSKRTILNLRTEINRYMSTDTIYNKIFNSYKPLIYENAWDIYSKIQACIEYLNQKLEDNKWEDQ